MNYDRLLTRIYDTQEKKMLYLNGVDEAPEVCIENVGTVKILGINGNQLIVSDYDEFESFDKTSIYNIDMPSYFVPMQCYGEKDKKDKLFYEGDIFAYKDITAEIYVEDGLFMILHYDEKYQDALFYKAARLNKIHGYKNPPIIIGNKWENPELLEGKA